MTTETATAPIETKGPSAPPEGFRPAHKGPAKGPAVPPDGFQPAPKGPAVPPDGFHPAPKVASYDLTLFFKEGDWALERCDADPFGKVSFTFRISQDKYDQILRHEAAIGANRSVVYQGIKGRAKGGLFMKVRIGQKYASWLTKLREGTWFALRFRKYDFESAAKNQKNEADVGEPPSAEPGRLVGLFVDNVV